MFSPFSAGASGSPPSDSLTGPVGLNLIPSARMDEAGTIKAGISALDPYLHSYIGLQLADPLYINIRQTAEASSLNEDPDRFHPGVDIKLRLAEETRSRPAIALGLQSAIGSKRMAGEYLAFSKRYKSFDLTGGIGWGRFGTAQHFDNPLGGVFKKSRALDGEDSNEPDDWFTGEKAGLFAGLEYFTPLQGLSLKFDYGADRYSAEAAVDPGFEKPAPWSAGVSYSPKDWINFGLAMLGTDKIMSRITLKGNLENWRRRDARTKFSEQMRPFRTGLALPSAMELSAEKDYILLSQTSAEAYKAQTILRLNPHISGPRQYGAAAMHMANHAGPAVEELEINPVVMGLRGPAIKLMRKDLENMLALQKGSPQEIWQHADFAPGTELALNKPRRSPDSFYGFHDFHITLENQFSLSEEDSGALIRSSLLAGGQGPGFLGLIDTGYELRFELGNNLDRLTTIRPPSATPVRSDVDVFADRGIAIERTYAAFTHSFRTDLHVSLIGGYLEEMFAGGGGEILYRPFGPRWAVGAEGWSVFKRDPYTPLNLGLTGEEITSAHLTLWYDMPKYDLTLHAKAGRYLGEDIGGSLTLQKNFTNGAKLEGFVTLTDQDDYDIFGGRTAAYSGVRLSLPLGGFKYMPENASVKFEAAPFGRDSGQSLRNPLPLYELTEPFSYGHMIRHWDEIAAVSQTD